MSDLITQEELKRLHHYDPETGDFICLTRNPKRRVGDLAGTINKNGYRVISFGPKKYAAHRLVWLYVYGRWPTQEIDHINGVRTDNRLCNLREATRRQNLANMALKKSSQSGYKGVALDKRCNKYYATIRWMGKVIWLGYGPSALEAHEIYLRAAAQLHGSFLNSERSRVVNPLEDMRIR